MWTSEYGDAALRQDDPGLIFSVGCVASIPDCSPFYKGTAREFECYEGGWGELL
jgi:hypothetical protein